MELGEFESNNDEKKIYRLSSSDFSLEYGSSRHCQSCLSTTKGKIVLCTLTFIIAAGTFIGGYFVGREYDIFPNSKADSSKATPDNLKLTTILIPFTPSSSSTQERNNTSILINITNTETPVTVAIITTPKTSTVKSSTTKPTLSEKTSTESIKATPTTVEIPSTTPTPRWINTNCSIPQGNTCSKSSLPLILISLDGFRDDYLKKNLTPNIQHLLNCGLSTYMRPVYPTVTFPNHYTLVTGLYPESHGIIDNNMNDPDLKKFFTMSNSESKNPDWWLAEPIWNTVRKSGKKSAVYFWPGSEVNISGMYPNVWRQYNQSEPFTNRIQTVLKWLNQSGEEQKDFIALYYHEPDSAGHKVGPYNYTLLPETLEEIDNAIDELMQGIFDLGLLKCVNIIIVADHGMDEISCNRLEVLEHYNVTVTDYVTFQGAAARIELRNQTQSIEDVLEKIQCKSPNFNVFKKEDFPKRLHYAKSNRISPVIIEVKPKWIFSRTAISYTCDGGSHGYDNLDEGMNALFGAYGPAFKENYKAEPFNNFELYNLMAEILNIKPSPNNGTQGSLHYLLRQNPSPPEEQKIFDYDKCVAPTNLKTIEDLQAIASCFGDEIDQGSGRIHSRSASTQWYTPANTRNTSICLLENKDFYTGFSNQLRYPIWVAYKLSGEKEIVNVTTNSEMKTHPDLRMKPDSLPCCDLFRSDELNPQNMTKGFLFPLEYSIHGGENNTALIASNLVLFYINFAQGVWREIHLYIQKWRNHFKSIQVISGPIFDYNLDGLPDESGSIRFVKELPVASHYFIVVTKCLEEKDVLDCNSKLLDVIAFILPHRNELPCIGIEEYMNLHSAHVRDVELITGLQLYPGLPIYDAIRLRVKLPRALDKFLEK